MTTLSSHHVELENGAENHEINDDSITLLNRPVTPRQATVEQWKCGTVTELVATVTVCILYALVGPMLILCNKWLMSHGDLPYPIFITAFSQISTSLISFCVVRVFRLVPRQHEFSWRFYMTNVASVGLATAITLCLGNSAYLFLSMARESNLRSVVIPWFCWGIVLACARCP